MKTKKAFSLIEVVFVLVILGIVASIVSQIIVQVYENYILQRAIYNVSTKTELVANQIVNRLTYRVHGTTISKKHEKFLAYKNSGSAIDENDWNLTKDLISDKYTTLEWIGYDNDSFSSDANPNWSGVANYEDAKIEEFKTNGSNLVNTSTIIKNLSNGKVNLAENPASVIFMERNRFYKDSEQYNPLCMGMIPELAKSSTDCIFPVSMKDSSTLIFDRKKDPYSVNYRPKIITDRYKLSYSAYAIAPESDGKGLYSLVLYSNYQPWNGESYITDGEKHTLMRNLSVFKFKERDGVIRFKLCATEILGDTNVSTCKEKAVIQ